MPQTSYSSAPALGVAGGLYAATGTELAVTKVASEAIVPGDFVIRGTTDPAIDKVDAAAAADPDGWSAALASAATVQNVTTFAGALGTSRQKPPRNAVLVLSNNGDWNETDAVFTYLDEQGNTKSLTFHIPDGGNITLTSLENDVCVPVNLMIPPQAGAGGTATLGSGTDKGAMSGRDIVGIAKHDPGLVSGNNYAAADVVEVWRKGIVNVYCEDAATAGGNVYCRVTAGAGERLGSVRATPDGTAGNPDCVPVTGARFHTTTSGAGIVAVELDLG